MSDHVTLPRKQVKDLYRAVVGFLAATLLLGSPLLWMAVQQERTNNHQAATDRRLETLIRSEAAEDRVEDAEQCVTSWEVRGQIRASDRTHSVESAEALIEVVNPDDPDIVALYRAVLDHRLQEAGRQVGDPDCDLAAARAVIDSQSTQPEE